MINSWKTTLAKTLTSIAFFLAISGLFGPSVANGAEEKGKKYAVLAGVRNYDHNKLDALEFTENDVTEMADFLRDAGYEVHLLSDRLGAKDSSRMPTKANIEHTLTNVLDKTKREDLVLVAFAGHGLQFDGKPEAFFCPKDANPSPDKTDTLIGLDKIYKQLDDSGAGVKLLLVDACRNDPQGGRGRGVNAGSVEKAPPKGVYAFFSCAAGERAYEHKMLKHGVFFHFVLAGLKGEAKDSEEEVTFEALALYVRKKVPQKVNELIQDAKQSPTLRATEASGASPTMVHLKRLKKLQGMVDAEILREDERVWTEALKANLFELYSERVFHYVSKDKVKFWEKTAKEGNPIGQEFYAICLRYGVHVEQDYKAAFAYASKAAESGNRMAMFSLGCLYSEGLAVQQDQNEARKWHEKASERGFIPSTAALGVFYLSGNGVMQNLNVAINLLSKASSNGSAIGMASMATYYRSQGNNQMAQQLFEKGNRSIESAKQTVIEWSKR